VAEVVVAQPMVAEVVVVAQPVVAQAVVLSSEEEP